MSNLKCSTSPLIYVAFQSMVAHDYCGPVGSSYTMTTLSFPPNQLMTGASVIEHLRLPRYSGYSDFVWTTMNPYDLTA